MQSMGDRQGLLFRELTKIHEECRQGLLSDLKKSCAGKNRGEFVVIVHGAPQEATDKPDELDDLILWYRDQAEMTLKDAVRNIAADLDLSRTKIYKRALSLWER